MAKETFPLNDSRLADLDCSLSFQKHPERIPVPINELGIVVPPPMLDCMGEDCRFRDDNETCRLTRHHLHSSAPFYEAAGTLASDFRDLNYLTVWIYACRHNEHHDKHIIDVPLPSAEVMKQCITETRKLRRVDVNYHNVRGVDKTTAKPGRTKTEITSLRRAKERLVSARKDLLKDVASIEILPQELVTGALLVTAPSHARSRIMMGSDYVLTGNILRGEAPTALISAREILLEQTAA